MRLKSSNSHKMKISLIDFDKNKLVDISCKIIAIEKTLNNVCPEISLTYLVIGID